MQPLAEKKEADLTIKATGKKEGVYEKHPAVNQDLTSREPHTVDVARHHIIPKDRLKVLWNHFLAIFDDTVVEKLDEGDEKQKELARKIKESINEIRRSINSFVDEIKQNFNNYNNFSNDYKDHLKLLGNMMNEFPHYEHKKGKDCIPGYEWFETLYRWLPGNLFFGPRLRSDDPKNEFEQNCGVIIGENESVARKEVYDKICTFTKQPLRGETSVKKAGRIVTLAKSAEEVIGCFIALHLPKKNEPWPLNPANWEPDPPDSKDRYMIKKSSPVPPAVESPGRDESATSLLRDPTKITIGHTDISLELIGSETDYSFTRGEITDVPFSFRDILQWCKDHQFAPAVPGELQKVEISGLVVEIVTTAQRQTTTLTVNTNFDVSGTEIDLLLDLECTTTNNATLQTPSKTAFALRAEAGFNTIIHEKETRIWFRGDIQKKPPDDWSFAASWEAFKEGLSVIDIARALGFSDLQDSDLTQLIPKLTSASFSYNFTKKTLAAAFTTDTIQTILVSLPAENKTKSE